jgi:hypothetical protein
MSTEILEQARKILREDYDTNLAVYIVRDLPATKDAGLSDLAWSMYRHGCVASEVENLIDSIEAGHYLK